MVRVILGTILAFWLGVTSVSHAAPANIVVFVVDDLGQRDIGCYGSSFYETPHVDRLAREGARFTNGYAACPVCSPTRASLMTGRWPQRTGVTDYIGADSRGWKRNTQLLPADYADRLAHSEITLAEMLHQSGYATFFAGKWHLGPEGWYPEDQGFDINRGGIDRGGPYGGNKYFSPYGNPRLTDGPAGEHLPDRLATETCRFIEEHKEKPFLAYFAFYSVHTPLMARKDLQEKYEAKRSRLSEQTRWGREDTRDVRLAQDHAVYAAMVEAMDLAVGKVLAKLDELHLAENTLVVFTSDNGGLSTSEGWPTSNLPLRGGKGWLYEGGLRVPLIIRWPAQVRPGQTIVTPACSPDLLPTAIAAAESQLPSDHVVDGVNLLPTLEGETLDRPLYWHYPHYGNQGGAPGSAVRLGDYKLIEWSEGNRRELFNVARDEGEQTDLSTAMPEKVQELGDLLTQWRREVGATQTAPNPRYDATRPSGRAGGRPAELRSGVK
jgi:arylsulfatase A-like enzyme